MGLLQRERRVTYRELKYIFDIDDELLKDRYFTQNYPAWTAIGSPALAMPGLLVEIKATAVLQG